MDKVDARARSAEARSSTALDSHPPRVAIVTLGCPKNVVDSEKMLGRLQLGGCEIAASPEEADVIIVNTCGFIDAAKRESVTTILDMARLTNGDKRLIVTGCLVERYEKELRAELPEVDGFLGVTNQEKITALVGIEDALPSTAVPRSHVGPPHVAYLKVSEGCNQTCSFCAIPGIRGRQRSRPIEEILDETAQLVSGGVTELILVSQDTTSYGKDLADRPSLAPLIRRLAAIRDLRWIRLNYFYPNHLTDELLETMSTLPNVCRYVDIPLQHADAEVLAEMRRGGSATSHLRLLARIRKAIPGVFLRSTFIVGFPNETPERFDRLLTFLREARFDYAGVFTYSREEGTGAWGLGDPVPSREKRRRRGLAMEVQREVSHANNRARIGQEHEAVVDGLADNYYMCRISGQAPDVDGITRLACRGAETLEPGDYLRARITDATAYDLRAELVGDR